MHKPLNKFRFIHGYQVVLRYGLEVWLVISNVHNLQAKLCWEELVVI